MSCAPRAAAPSRLGAASAPRAARRRRAAAARRCAPAVASAAPAPSSAAEASEAQAREFGSDWEVLPLPFRVGHGFDLHRLEPGYELVLGGVKLPHDVGCQAHSDGDVVLHCVVDAILGALGLPDIGQLFPDSDPRWKGQTSDVFLREAVRRMDEVGYRVGNMDVTLILQKPKVSPIKEQIRANIAEQCGTPVSVINVKAKTHEKVDSLGENRSVACHTVVSLLRKEDYPEK